MRMLLDHGVVIGLHWCGATLVFVVLKQGGVCAVVAHCVPVVIRWVVQGLGAGVWWLGPACTHSQLSSCQTTLRLVRHLVHTWCRLGVSGRVGGYPPLLVLVSSWPDLSHSSHLLCLLHPLLWLLSLTFLLSSLSFPILPSHLLGFVLSHEHLLLTDALPVQFVKFGWGVSELGEVGDCRLGVIGCQVGLWLWLWWLDR
jgi:hypothetical protein